MNRGLLRAVWLGAAAGVAGAAIAAIVTVVRGQPGEEEAKTVYSLVAVFICGGAAVAALELLDRPRLRLLGAAALLAAAVELTLLEIGIWEAVLFDGQSSDYVKLIPTGLAWGIATLVVATLPLLARSPWLRLGALAGVGACAVAGATIATIMVWREIDSITWAKTLAVIAIAMIAGYLITPLAERITRLEETSTSPTSAFSDTSRV